MMTKITNWMNKPWTNGSYLKLCGIIAVIYAVFFAGCALYVKWEEVVSFKDRVIAKFRSGKAEG